MRLESLRLKIQIQDPRGTEARNGFERAQYDMDLDHATGEICIRQAGLVGGVEVCTHVSNAASWRYFRESVAEKGKGK